MPAVQVSQLNELMIYLGHEADAATLQAAFDALAKAFVAAAEQLQDALPPPADSSEVARQAARRGAQALQRRLWELQEARWKWDALRPLDA